MLNFRRPLNTLPPRCLSVHFKSVQYFTWVYESGASRVHGKELTCWHVQLGFVEHHRSTAFVGFGPFVVSSIDMLPLDEQTQSLAC